ncbi:MAG: NfeD family protein [Ilumatobacteraceae bacterium]|jgi:membrane-bound serine protease (ClpP class)
MRRTLAVACLAAACASPAVALAAGDADAGALAPVDVVEVNGLVDDVVVHSIERAIARAESGEAQALVLQVDSDGAVASRARIEALFERIAASRVPIGVWVGPTTARAMGAAAQLVAAADVSAMAPGTEIGRTGRLLAPGGTTLSFGAATDELRTGLLDETRARELGALRLDIPDDGVPVVRNMLLAMDGLAARGVVLDTVRDTVQDATASGGGGTDQVVREATTARFFKLGAWERLLHTVASPAVTFLLATIGLALLIFELFTAGIGIAGSVAATCIVLAGHGVAVLPIRPLGAVALVAAMVAFAIDVQVGIPRLFTAVGTALYVVAALTIFGPSDAGPIRLPVATLVTAVVGTVLAFTVGMPSMVRTRFATPTIGREWMIGREGVAVGAIGPDGVARVEGATWRARTNRATPIADGDGLRVVAIDGVTLEVEPLVGAARDYRERRGRD